MLLSIASLVTTSSCVGPPRLWAPHQRTRAHLPVLGRLRRSTLRSVAVHSLERRVDLPSTPSDLTIDALQRVRIDRSARSNDPQSPCWPGEGGRGASSISSPIQIQIRPRLSQAWHREPTRAYIARKRASDKSWPYAILEGEAPIAARIVGLDPGLGVLHADQLNRDSLSAALMEPIRPLVDRYVFELLARRTFAANDFFETRQGVCRVTPPLARELAGATLDWGRAAGRVAEDVARRLADDAGAGPVPTPVSGRNRSAGRRTRASVEPSTPRASRSRGCSQCGSPTTRARRTCSAACETAARQDQDRGGFYGFGAEASPACGRLAWSRLAMRRASRSAGSSASASGRRTRGTPRTRSERTPRPSGEKYCRSSKTCCYESWFGVRALRSPTALGYGAERRFHMNGGGHWWQVSPHDHPCARTTRWPN